MEAHIYSVKAKSQAGKISLLHFICEITHATKFDACKK